MARVDRALRLIKAPPSRVYQALVDPELLGKWLPPKGARGTINEFDARPGGGFCMTITFEETTGAKGKSTNDTDVVKGRFIGLEPERRVSQQFEFQSPDPAFAGTMAMTWSLEPRGEATMLTVTAEDVPVGISAEDHEAGMASSLANLAALFNDAPRSV